MLKIGTMESTYCFKYGFENGIDRMRRHGYEAMDYQEFVDLYGQAKIDDGVLYAKDLKDRYSVLWLYYEFFR